MTDVNVFGDPVVGASGGSVNVFGDPVVEPPQEGGIMGAVNRTMEGIPIVGAHYKAGRNLAAAVTNPETWQRGAETIANDIQGGTQGVNPTATQEAVRSGQAIGELIKQPGMKPYISVYDGPQMAPLSDYPADKFTTVMQDGTTYVVPRNATDSAGEGIEEGPLASLGRLFGYGIPNSRPINASMAEAPAAVAPAPRQEAAQAAQDLGITPSLGMTGTAGSKAAAAGEQFAPTAVPIRRDAERVTSEIAGAANRIADKAGPGVTPFDAGTALQEGGETYVKGVRDYQGALFNAVDKAIAPDTRIGTPETTAFIRGELGKLSETPNIAKSFGDGTLAGWLSDLEGGKSAPVAKVQKGPAQPTTVMEALQEIGVNDPGGDLASMGVRGWDKSKAFRRNVLREDGMSPDLAARWLWERGYLHDGPEAQEMALAERGMAPEPDLVQAMHRAIDDEMAGEPRFAQQDWEQALDWREALERGDRVDDLATDAGNAGGALTWEAARALRSKIGEMIGDYNGPQRDIATGRLKAIYGKLTDDLRAASEAAGPEAAHAWNRAQTYTRVSEDRIRTAFGKILKADTPERAYSILTGYAAEGASGSNITALKRVMQSLPDDDRAVVAGTIIRRLGRASAGAQDAAGEAFSPATFLTNWNKMSPEARATIARNGLDDGVADELTKLAKVAERFKASGADRNHSNTAGTMSQIALASGVIGALFGGGSPMAAAGIVAGAAGANVSARFLTNPRVLHALNRAAATGELTALKRIAEGQGVTPEIAMEAATILRLQLQGAGEPSSPQSPPTGYGQATSP